MGSVPREIASKRPMDIIETTSDEPPKLIKGNGTPVMGARAVTTAMLINA